MAEPEIMPVAGGSASVYSHRCPEKISGNEDAAAVVPVGDTAAVLIVADGLGGSALGEKAARLATEAVVAAISTAIDKDNGEETVLRTAILNGIENANNAVREFGGGAQRPWLSLKSTIDRFGPTMWGTREF